MHQHSSGMSHESIGGSPRPQGQYLVQENPPAPLRPTRRQSPHRPNAEAGPRCPELWQPSPPALRDSTQRQCTGAGSGESPAAQPQPGAASRGSARDSQGLIRGQCFVTPCSARALGSHTLASGPSCCPPPPPLLFIFLDLEEIIIFKLLPPCLWCASNVTVG